MSDGASTRRQRNARPTLEGLEGRQLLSGAYKDKFGNWHNLVIHDKDLSRWRREHTADPPVVASDRRYEYQTKSGGRVVVTLYGAGSLDAGKPGGTNYDPAADALDVRFKGTNQNSGIVAKVYGGNGRANLRSLIHANLPANSVSGVGSTLLRVANFKDFDLIENGRINLTGGVQTFFLNSAGPNTQINLREIPPQLLYQNQTSNVSENGVTYGFVLDVSGANTLTSVGGGFLPGFNLLPTTSTTKPNKQLPPPGVVAVINQVNGRAGDAVGLARPQTFAYDPVTNSLVRFEIALDLNNPETGTIPATPSLTIPSAVGNPGADVGVSLSRFNGKLVVLANDGDNVYAYDPTTGSKLGQFSVASLAQNGKKATRLGTVDSFTVVGLPDGVPANDDNGLIQVIDVTTSLLTGQVKTVGTPFASQRAFGQSGGYASVPGSSTLYAAGGAHFDPYQPNQFQLGLQSLSASGSGGLRESARNALVGSGGRNTTTDAHGASVSSPNNALGNVDLALALITGYDDAAKANTVTLYNPTSFSATGNKVLLAYPNQLTALTSVFRPGLAGEALVDIQGNVQSFRAQNATGLVLNDLGNLNQVSIHKAVDTVILGYPFGHAQIPIRDNVAIFSSARTVGDRNGVTVLSNYRPFGPLTLPG